MARVDRSSAHQGNGSFNIRLTSTVAVAREVLVVPVFKADTALFEGFVSGIWEAMNEQWGFQHDGLDLPVTREELVAYAYTAVKARTGRVNNQRFYVRCDDGWCIPAIIAHIVNQIGRVSIEVPVMTITPVWDAELDQLTVPDIATWWSITNRMKVIQNDGDMRVVFVKALSGEKIGSPDVMALVPVRDELGRIARVYGDKPVDGLAAAVYLMSGFSPSIYDGLSLSAHPGAIPRGNYYIDTGAVVQSIWRLIDTASA